jgi:hypothetical protein
MVTVPKKNKSQAASPATDTRTVTTGQQPVIGCALCEWTRGYDPAATTASTVLTDHYNRDHAAALTSA